ncbi:MAG: hypothetical protein OEY43_04710 [Gammaproteobacteria bacterium]|nr:hypothetical protein [Gammaproteobacteria bacterium]
MNRHKRMAILIAPFLAIGGYIAADYYYQGQQAEKLPRLVSTGDCRPVQKNCRLQAGDLALDISMDSLQPGVHLPVLLESSVALDDVLIALGDGGVDQMPLRMQGDQQAVRWHADILLDPSIHPGKLLLRLVVTYKANNYFAELSVKP